MPNIGDIEVIISLSNLPEHKRRSYCVQIEEYIERDGQGRWVLHSHPEWADCVKPKYFKTLKKALEYTNQAMLYREH